MKLRWQHELYEPLRFSMATALSTIQTSKDEIRQLQEAKDASVLSSARIIGCTTTKAAMCKDLIDGLSPGIVLVEEAGEILESHVLTSLSAATERLVMIGDHKQLRPKCQHFPLTVESGRGYDLNRSLFERLANSLPIATLEAQHRMHPDISSIPKLVTYPTLKDAQTVISHPMPRGIARRVVFIDHGVEEDREAESTAIDMASRTNTHEVEMVCETVRYLLQQGYEPADLVVLTPYLGQMMRIQRAMSKYVDSFVDERDLADARDQLGSDAMAQTKNDAISNNRTTSHIRVATIDNYQGEEANIVLVSLVRSNAQASIGFLREAERVNVMLSRARQCEIIFGNKATLENAKGSFQPLKGGQLWRKIFNHLQTTKSISTGLEVKCQLHGTLNTIVEATDFQKLCPDGGCTRPCDKPLQCGHFCTKRCHVGPCSSCRILCSDTCSRGHKLMRECSKEPGPCGVIVSWKCPLGHRLSGPCSYGTHSRKQCMACAKLANESEGVKEKEHKLQSIFDSKYEELRELNSQVEEARRAKRNREDLDLLETELRCASEALDELLQDTLMTEAQNDNGSIDKNVIRGRIKRILDSSAEGTMDLDSLSHDYRSMFSSDIGTDAVTCGLLDKKFRSRRGQKRKLKEIVEQISFCEILPDQRNPERDRGKTLVRLRASEITQSNESTEHCSEFQNQEDTMDAQGDRTTENSESYNEVVDGKTLQAAKVDVATMEEAGGSTSADMSHALSKLHAFGSAGKGTAVRNSGTAEAEDDTCDKYVRAILRRYSSHGALGADDLIQQVLHDKKAEHDAIYALQSIMHHELDPVGECDIPKLPETSKTRLSKFIRAVANAFVYEENYPRQARQWARLALKIIESLDAQSDFPASWRDRIQSLSVLESANRELSSRYVAPVESRRAWEAILAKNPDAPAIMTESVLPMIGLESVKLKFVQMYHRLLVAKEQGDHGASSHNVRFEGNPGTGKTTIARHYAEFLKQAEIIGKQSIFRETSGANLMHVGLTGLKSILDEIKEAEGGIIFVDEAYQLKNDREGKKMLDFILPIAESMTTEYGDIVWIFAGYKKPMEELFEHNIGLPSRFPNRFVFDDYSNEELLCIFQDMMAFSNTLAQNINSEKSGEEETGKSLTKSPLRGYQYPQEGESMAGRRGGVWTYSHRMGWVDEYGNMTVNPSSVGLNSSPLVDRNGKHWLESGGAWVATNGKNKQMHYPGSPCPPLGRRQKRPKPFTCVNEKHLRIAIRRLGRNRGSDGFGNARAVRVLFDRVRDRQAERITIEKQNGKKPDVFVFEEIDLLGPRIMESTLKQSMAYQELNQLEGLKPVKESISRMFELVLKNAEREQREEKLFGVSLNRLFLGNPGTGKTTVAELYGRILADLGLLSKGEVILKCASDFIGEALGQSEKKTQAILKAAEGNVLVIDEAYSLYYGGPTKGSNDPYKTAVIDTIVEKVQARPGADIAVIMLGYQDEMEEMMRNVNPGLSRRFQLEDAFVFPDFDDASLCRIMLQSARERDVKLSISVAKRAVRLLAKARAKPNFGNAGSVNNLLSKAILHMQSRENATELTPEDFGCAGDGTDTSVLDTLFDDLIGCVGIKNVMDELRATVLFSVAQGMPPSSSVSFNYLFLGNPGTGKTTVARRMGKMFHALGLLAGDDMKEVKASEMVTGYVGQAGKCTREMLKSSLGGVLFIDEAYQLNPNRGGSFMSEVIDELVGALTEEEFKGKVLVILAGYDGDMEEMLRTNPGLQSRFSERVHFRDFDVHATLELLDAELERKNIPLAPGFDAEKLKELAQELVDSPGFGNGRDVVTWADRTYKSVAKRGASDPAFQFSSVDAKASMACVEEALKGLLQSRVVRGNGPYCVSTNVRPIGAHPTQSQDRSPPPTHTCTEESRVDMIEPDEQRVDKKEGDTITPDNLFEGMDSTVLSKLQEFVDEHELGSEHGARALAGMDPKSASFLSLVTRMQEELHMGRDEALSQLSDWQSRQRNLEKMLEQQKQSAKTMGVRPIWRCGVCGRADKPWIECYVAPFIVRYEKVPVSLS